MQTALGGANEKKEREDSKPEKGKGEPAKPDKQERDDGNSGLSMITNI